MSGSTTSVNTLSATTLTAPANLSFNPAGSLDFKNKSILNFNYPPFTQSTIGSAVLTLQSTAASGANPVRTYYQNKALTTDATLTTLQTFTVPASTAVAVKVYVTATRSGGTAGATGDSAFYEYNLLYVNISGDATLVSSYPVNLSSAGITWGGLSFSASLTTVTISVTGAVNNNITWILNMETMPAST